MGRPLLFCDSARSLFTVVVYESTIQSLHVHNFIVEVAISLPFQPHSRRNSRNSIYELNNPFPFVGSMKKIITISPFQ